MTPHEPRCPQVALLKATIPSERHSSKALYLVYVGAKSQLRVRTSHGVKGVSSHGMRDKGLHRTAGHTNVGTV